MRQETIDTLVNTPNLISYTRALLIIPFFIFYPNRWLMLTIFILAVLSDWLDGFFAKRNNQASQLGAIIDPLCDKIFIVSIVLLFFFQERLTGFQLVVLLLRDFFVAGFTILLVTLSRFDHSINKFKKHLKSRWTGKITTILLFTAIFWLILSIPHFEYYIFMVLIVAIITIIDYSILYAKEMTKDI